MDSCETSFCYLERYNFSIVVQAVDASIKFIQQRFDAMLASPLNKNGKYAVEECTR